MTSTELLDFLGRRIERLIFVGILLILVCFAEAYVATVNKQIREDRHAMAITYLLSRLESDESRLTELYQSKSESLSARNSTISAEGKREKAVNETRIKLGLPPPAPKPKASSQEPVTYGEALRKIVLELRLQYPELGAEFAQHQYSDFTTPPKKLIDTFTEKKKVLESSPTTVWGIQTPRLLQFQYAGIDYKFPFGFVSNTLAIVLAPMIVGWLGALTFTRQRELLLITSLDDYKLAFPHILNILPVNFIRIERLFQQTGTAKDRISRRRLNILMASIFRTFFILLITLPLVFGFLYSIVQLFDLNKDLGAIFLYVGFFMAFVMFNQMLYLAIQEWTFLHKKEFYE
ncbi:MAG: hypothetical protein Q7T65_13035 [Thiobacillus sp.]|nr:hypothetical protein [Thiobacillus sp.]